MPVGHIALEMSHDKNLDLCLPGSTVWIKSLYISWYVNGVSSCPLLREHVRRLVAW